MLSHLTYKSSMKINIHFDKFGDIFNHFLCLIMIYQTDLGGKCGKSSVDIKATVTRQHIKKYHYTEFMNFNILTRFFLQA